MSGEEIKFYSKSELARIKKLSVYATWLLSFVGFFLSYGVFYYFQENIVDLYFLTKELLRDSIYRIR